jgi:hypothetical protein
MMELIINPAGCVRCVYGEAIDLHTMGSMAIRRASHVEPDDAGAWWADMSPVGGPKIGPHQRRSEAITAELQWLREWMNY